MHGFFAHCRQQGGERRGAFELLEVYVKFEFLGDQRQQCDLSEGVPARHVVVRGGRDRSFRELWKHVFVTAHEFVEYGVRHPSVSFGLLSTITFRSHGPGGCRRRPAVGSTRSTYACTRGRATSWAVPMRPDVRQSQSASEA